MIDQEDGLNRPRPKMGAGARKVRAANGIMFAQHNAQADADLRARNAYRSAVGLPLIEPSNN